MTRDEANQRLREAVTAHAEAYDILEPGVMLTDFIIVGAWVSTEGNLDRTYYTNQYPQTYMPTHTCVGLLELGLERLLADMEED